MKTNYPQVLTPESKECDQDFSFMSSEKPDALTLNVKEVSIEEAANSIKLNLTPEQEFVYNLLEKQPIPSNKLLDAFMQAFNYTEAQYDKAHSKVALIITNLVKRKLIVGTGFSGEGKMTLVQTKLL
jgi:hypothetical protein